MMSGVYDDQLPSVATFFKGLFDYAGLFPPAELSVQEALEEYIGHMEEDEAWMLASFILAPKHLQRLTDEISKLDRKEAPLELTVSFPGSSDETSFIEQFDEHLQGILKSQGALGEAVSFSTLEIPVPPLVMDGYDELISKVSSEVRQALGADCRLFIEVPWTGTYKKRFSEVADTLKTFNESSATDNKLGFKLRCGGVEPEMVPAPQIVADALFITARSDIPFKATAGLHHPVRHFSEEFKGFMHGFLNVFGAGMLSRHHDMKEQDILSIIVEEDPSVFHFHEGSFSWRHVSINANDINSIRNGQILSFGSCSFQEPREDLQSLGILSL